MRKIDEKFKKVAIMSSDNKLFDCLVEVNNFAFANDYLQKNGLKVEKSYKFLNILALKAKKNEIFNIERLPFVKYIYGDVKVLALTNVSRKILGTENVKYYGTGINVAIIDTGICSHFDFVIGKNRIIKFIDLVNGKKTNYDDNGHGTFVSGVLAGNGLISHKKYRGFAPNCNIISLKALDDNGEANALTILDAMEWVYKNAKKFNIKVVCMSFGSEPIGINDPIMRGAEKLWNSGIVVVAAAGNSGPKYETIKSPGISPKIITVGGFNDNRIGESFYENFFEIADFSSRGPAFNKIKPDLVAPSVDIVSCSLNNSYTTLSGTSVATPMIAGICTLIVEKYPNLKPDQIKQMILRCCKGIVHNFNQEGMGYPNIS